MQRLVAASSVLLRPLSGRPIVQQAFARALRGAARSVMSSTPGRAFSSSSKNPATGHAQQTPPPDLSACGLYKSDPELSNLAIDKYYQPADDETVASVARALEAAGHRVTVADTPAEALELLRTIVPAGASVSSCGSATLREVGFVDYLKTRKDIRDFKAAALTAQAQNQPAEANELRRQGLSADYFFTSVSAVTHKGEMISADQTGTRVGALPFTARNVIIVTGTNKIVPTLCDGMARVMEFALPLSTSFCKRVFGFPSSANSIVIIRGASPLAAPQRIHVVLVKGAYGF